ncbi:MAG: heme ABC transporter permease [Ketobacteraceae bacterium]|nr:heme ABC transporter permease [Ketobacteraceae bacterium]
MSLWDSVTRLYHKFGSPKYFYELSARLIPWFIGLTLLTLLPGLIWGLGFAPMDEEQGHSYRIIFIHVPAAGVAMGGYIMMALAAAVGLVWKMKMADMVAKAIAPIGASFTFLCLVTGSIWGKPTWGTWWVWDARLTSMLVLFFLYIGFIALQNAIENPVSAAKASGILAVVGVVNLPIIKYSVNWWNTLHQPATIKITESSTIDASMLYPLLLSMAGFYCFFGLLVLLAARNEVLLREQRSRWVQQEVMK